MDYGTTLKISDADLAIENYGLQMIFGVEKVQQDLVVLLTSWKRSYPFDAAFGVDYPNLVRMQSVPAIQAAISAALAAYKYTQTVLSVAVTRGSDRSVSISAQVLLIGGETVGIGVSL
jgi:hypothetical protein